ncbi:DNA mismatch repair protein MutT [Pedobacter kyungheensis]|uniref:ADP-ribose pyrophosphatase YjhB, NUDIX family n=2 Tax=Pedobacter TaxID=84567 RepID=A0A1G6Y2F3_9SPHI|nr:MULTISPECIES: NUDIX domain-containing protein [Pedobacter]KIA96867.1 DNA mismatch repair protein MutT [Pedobacter kyungheensis]SDD84482.1 ADP-ribose pyrophosphatase YjhB, NUDIX family [Pedobacter soli]
MIEYPGQPHYLVAVDCIVFGFDGEHLKILLVKRGLEPEINKWSLMGGFVGPDESPDDAANRVLKKMTGLEGVYLEQMQIYGEPKRDPIERTLSVGYFALIDIHKYETQLNDDYEAEWFLINERPKLIFDHNKMVADARKKLRYKASLHPILFEMLPKKFTIPQLHILFEEVNDTKIDTRNFSRKITSTGLLIKLEEKDKTGSKKGAFYFKLDKKKYTANSQAFLNLMPNLRA